MPQVGLAGCKSSGEVEEAGATWQDAWRTLEALQLTGHIRSLGGLGALCRGHVHYQWTAVSTETSSNQLGVCWWPALDPNHCAAQSG